MIQNSIPTEDPRAERKRIRRLRGMIRTGNDPVLSATCAAFDWEQDSRGFIDTMVDVLLVSDGVGLAAPQIGITKRVIVLMPPLIPLLVMINPQILQRSKETEVGPEGCLSYPGLEAQIRRHWWVEVSYENLVGQPQHRRLYAFPARVCQHEMDHLVGLCQVKQLGTPVKGNKL